MKTPNNPIKRYLLVLLVSISPAALFAQMNTFSVVFDTLSLGEQFDYLYKKSNTYEDYKVIKIGGYNLIKKNTQDSIQHYKKEITSLNQEIASLNNKLNINDTEINGLKEELAATQNSKDSIQLLGAETSKSAYNLIMWGLLIAATGAAIILFLLFKRGHLVVKETRNRLEEIKEDFETHRKNALTREQKLARELMDVKLKYKGR